MNGPRGGSAATVADLCRQLDVKTHEYGEIAAQRAVAEAEYKAAKARRVLTARAEGARSIAEAETIATADTGIAVLHREHLIADAMADAAQKSIYALRTRIEVGRSFLATERAGDLLHGQAAGGQS